MADESRNRELKEISFDDFSTKAGQIPAYDFFGDGSFYLLSTPGHAVGHIGGIARTSSNPDTFIFMGADLCHSPAVMRPTSHLPYPPMFSLPDRIKAELSFCPGDYPHALEALSKKLGRDPKEPLLVPNAFVDFDKSMETVKRAQEGDAQDNIWFVFAHDSSLQGVVKTFPEGANDWKAKGWKEDTMWKFIKDLAPATEKSNE